MRKIVILSVLLLTILTLSIIYLGIMEEHKKYTDYADFSLSIALDSMCSSIIRTDTILKNILEKKYVLESELYSLESLHKSYAKALYSIIDIAKYLKNYEFQVTIAPEAHDFSWLHDNLYYFVDDIFRDEYKYFELEPSYKRNLSHDEIKAFEQYHDYISHVAAKIRENFEHYSSYDVTYEEKEENGKFIMIGHTGLKEDYDYDENMTYGIRIKSSEDNWLEFLKQIRQLHIQ